MKHLIKVLCATLMLSTQLQAQQTDQETQYQKGIYELKVSDQEGAIIEEIITTMGKTNTIALGFKQGHLKALGKKLNGVGALQFLAYIFTKDHLKTHMASIRSSSFKWNGFVDGLKSGLNKEADTNELFEALPSFSKAVNVEYEVLLPRAKNRDWPSFIAVLISH